MKFIDNLPTVENLESLYNSKMYQDLLTRFDERSKHKLDTREHDRIWLLTVLTHYKGRYVILNIPFEEVLSEFEKDIDEFLEYELAATAFFIGKKDDHPDGEFPKGEQPGKDDKSVVIESFGIARSFFIDKFCEYYLLRTGDKERLLHFLKTTRMPYAKKYAGQITKIYKQISKR